MTKKRFVLIFLSAVLSLQLYGQSVLPVLAEEQAHLELYAKSAVLMDAESGRILYEKDGRKHMPNASTTKIMTCILAIENGKMEDEVAVSSYAASMPKVRLGMTTEDTFYLKDLLYSLMLESHNDSAAAIAEHIGGSVEGFADMMNQKAEELGCKDTYFITPNGLDAKDEKGTHGTTAADLCRIMRYCIQNETFLKITRTASYSFTNVAGNRSYNCNNHNAFLQMMEGALSGKTGFTGNAGYCYVGALKRGERIFVVALLACGWPNNKNYKWSDTKTLMNYGLEHYNYEDVFEHGKELAKVRVENAVPIAGKLHGQVNLPVRIEERKLSVLKRKEEQIRVIYDIPKCLEAPVRTGQKIGKVTYYLEEKQIGEFPVETEGKAEKRNFSWYLQYILELFWNQRELYGDICQ